MLLRMLAAGTQQLQRLARRSGRGPADAAAACPRFAPALLPHVTPLLAATSFGPASAFPESRRFAKLAVNAVAGGSLIQDIEYDENHRNQVQQCPVLASTDDLAPVAECCRMAGNQ